MRRGEILYSGAEMERDVLGECKLKPEAYEKLIQIRQNDGYVKYWDAVRWIEEFYDGDPTDPPDSFPNDLHATVAESLELEDYSELRYYSALKTPLDVYHGVDGFFTWRDVIATIDITKNPSKGKEYKADLLITQDPQKNEDEEQESYELRLRQYAQHIADTLHEKMELRRKKYG